MEKSKFIYIIESERHFNSIIRIMATFSRRRIAIIEMSSSLKEGEDTHRFMISILETKDNAVRLSNRLEREIDVLAVILYEHSSKNPAYATPEN